MNNHSRELELFMKIKIWQVGNGDALTVNFTDISGKPRNLFIDSGYMGTYVRTIKIELLAIQKRQEKVDLWVITHTDSDHIGGLEALLIDRSIKNKDALVTQFWFNWSDYSYMPPNPQISIRQGVFLREFLSSLGRLFEEDIIARGEPYDFFGCQIFILSPDRQRLENSKIKWAKTEKVWEISGGRGDYDKTIEELAKQDEEENKDAFNGGSIAFLLVTNGKNMLFLADSYPSVVVASLKGLGYSEKNRLTAEYVKLSHHGSKGNTSGDLIGILDCGKFIISAGGVTRGLPDKWTLAKILTHPSRDLTKRVEFLFNNDTPQLRSIFAIDKELEKYNMVCTYTAQTFLEVNL